MQASELLLTPQYIDQTKILNFLLIYKIYKIYKSNSTKYF